MVWKDAVGDRSRSIYSIAKGPKARTSPVDTPPLVYDNCGAVHLLKDRTN